MIEKNHTSEKGQAIIYLVLGIVVFLGFVALAIDGGMSLADRRHSQNAADAASLAGGGRAALDLDHVPVCYKNWTCANAGDAIAHAQVDANQRALDNGFNIDNNISDHNGYTVNCVDNAGKYIDVSVLISDTTTSNFLQLVFPDALHNEVDATTRVHPSQPINLDDAVIGLNPATCGGNNGVTFSGDATTYIEGGDVFSNGCIGGDGSAGSAVVISGTIEGHYPSPMQNLGYNFTPNPQNTNQTLQPSDFYIEPPALKANGDCLYGNTVNDLKNHSPLTGGLWCVKGNMNINYDLSLADLTKGVTIYMLNGHLVYNGNAAVNLSAPTTTENGGIPGVLFFVPNGNDVTLNGTSNDTFTGLIYAPKSTIKLAGDAENIFNGQVIGWNVKITGNNVMGVYFDECSGYMRPPFIELYK